MQLPGHWRSPEVSTGLLCCAYVARRFDPRKASWPGEREPPTRLRAAPARALGLLVRCLHWTRPETPSCVNDFRGRGCRTWLDRQRAQAHRPRGLDGAWRACSGEEGRGTDRHGVCLRLAGEPAYRENFVCGTAAGISIAASKMTKRLKGNEQEAIRHFVWMGAMSVILGLSIAKKIGDAHEWGLSEHSSTRADSARDQRNNKIARAYVRSSKSRLCSFYRKYGAGALMSLLYRQASLLYYARKLAVL